MVLFPQGDAGVKCRGQLGICEISVTLTLKLRLINLNSILCTKPIKRKIRTFKILVIDPQLVGEWTIKFDVNWFANGLNNVSMLNKMGVWWAPDGVSPLVYPVASHWLSLSPCLFPVPSLSPCLGRGSVLVLGPGPGIAHGFFGGCCGERTTWSSSAATDALVHCQEPEEIHQHHYLILPIAEEIQRHDDLSFPSLESMQYVFLASHHPTFHSEPGRPRSGSSGQNMKTW